MAAHSSAPQPAPPNRRRRVRHKIQTPAYASFTGESKGVILDLHEILDISEDGVAIQCNVPLPPNSHFDLCLDLAESTGHIYTSANVIWSNEAGRAGFRFSALPAASLFRLREWLFLNAMAGAANAQAEPFAALQSSLQEVAVRPNYTDTLAATTAVQREVEALGPDLVAALQLIATRARTLMRASGAAIALAVDDPAFMLCRASSGPDAPPIGARLQVGSGFSGECVRTGKLLRCDDSETDNRVDRDSCRGLGIRSILAAPVRVGNKVIGILEVFSPQPNSFSDNDGTVAQRLAETVLAAVNRTARSENLAPPRASNPGTPSPSPGSGFLASEATKKEDEKGKANAAEKHAGEKEESSSGVSLPRSHLIVLICAAATIALALGFILAPWLQERASARGQSGEQTVLASSRAPGAPAIVSPDSAVAMATFPQLQQLAAKGNPEAQYALGLRFAQGDPKDRVRQDEREAARWFTRAAEHGHVSAQSKLGSFYWGGRGLPQDLNKAYFWTVLARAGGDQGSKTLALVLSSHLTREQASAIEQQAEQWYRQHQAAMKPNAGR